MTALDATESKSFVPLAEHPDIRVLFGSGTIEALGEEAAQDGILSAPPCPTIIWEKSKIFIQGEWTISSPTMKMKLPRAKRLLAIVMSPTGSMDNIFLRMARRCLNRLGTK